MRTIGSLHMTEVVSLITAIIPAVVMIGVVGVLMKSVSKMN